MKPIGADMLPGEPIDEGFRVYTGSWPTGEVCFNGFLMLCVFMRLLPNLGIALLFTGLAVRQTRALASMARELKSLKDKLSDA